MITDITDTTTAPTAPASDTPSSTAEHRDRIVYVGTRPAGASGTWHAAFVWLTEDEIATPSHVPADVPRERLELFDVAVVKKFRTCAPGAIYAATKTEKGMAYAPTDQPVGFVPDAVRLVWQSTSRANDRVRRAELAIDKNGERDLFREQLEPVRETYNKLRGAARAQFLAEAVAYITRGY